MTALFSTAATLPPVHGPGGGTHTPTPFAGRGHKATLTPPALANRTQHVTSTKHPCADKPKDHTGEWPPTPASDTLLAQVRRERARRELTLGAIRADLEEQPSRAAIRASARRWNAAVNQLADDLIAARTNTENAA